MPFEQHPTDPDKLIMRAGNYNLQKPWVPLTDEERESVLDSVPPNNMGGEYYDKEITAIAIAIEAKLKEKNT